MALPALLKISSLVVERCVSSSNLWVKSMNLFWSWIWEVFDPGESSWAFNQWNTVDLHKPSGWFDTPQVIWNDPLSLVVIMANSWLSWRIFWGWEPLMTAPSWGWTEWSWSRAVVRIWGLGFSSYLHERWLNTFQVIRNNPSTIGIVMSDSWFGWLFLWSWEPLAAAPSRRRAVRSWGRAVNWIGRFV